MITRSIEWPSDEWGYHTGFSTRDCVVFEKPTQSKLLGPDGEPLEYEPHAFGFDLTPRGQR